ncbi:integral membrane protein [Mycobacterium tuberculosis]|nr:integral membrane protein [Mycobacterium tuberculosis]
MPTSDPGLRRVTVHAGAQAVDLTLPAAVPVATLIPSIVDILGDRGASPATAARYQLSALGAPALPNATTLAQCGIRDGAVLVLHKSSAQPPPPAVTMWPKRWRRRLTPQPGPNASARPGSAVRWRQAASPPAAA